MNTLRRLRLSFSGSAVDAWLGQGSIGERAGALVLLVVATTFTAAVAYQAWAMRQEVDALQRESEALRLSHPTQPSTVAAAPPLPAEAVRQLDNAVERLNVPWSTVLDTLERHADQAVAILKLEPDARSGTIALTTEAAGLDDLLAYSAALAQDANVASLQLGAHDVRTDAPGQPARLVLSLKLEPLQ